VKEGTVALTALHDHVELSVAVAIVALVHGGRETAGRDHVDTC
jgi:hypothetical protein